MDAIKSMVKAIEDDQSDDTSLLALADLLQEAGDERTGEALRWMVKHGRRPVRLGHGWRWFRRNVDGGQSHPRGRRMPLNGCWLPEIVGRELASRYPTYSRDWLVMVKRLGWALSRLRELVN